MTRKKAILLIVIPAAVLLIVFLGILTVFNSRDCSQLVIDTYELHSGIDIPEVKSINCYYDKARDVRISVYQLQTNVDQYINRQPFRPVQVKSDIKLAGFELLKPNEQPGNGEWIYAGGEKWGRTWLYVVEKETGRLWAEIQY
jgi:hypothetical protein